jgi:hypothetical protein
VHLHPHRHGASWHHSGIKLWQVGIQGSGFSPHFQDQHYYFDNPYVLVHLCSYFSVDTCFPCIMRSPFQCFPDSIMDNLYPSLVDFFISSYKLLGLLNHRNAQIVGIHTSCSLPVICAATRISPCCSRLTPCNSTRALFIVQ